MSPCLIRDSPTSMARAPASAKRSTSARVWMPLSATSSGAAAERATRGGQALGRGEVHLEGLQVAVIDANKFRPQGQGALQLGLIMHLDQYGQASARGQPVQAPQLRIVSRWPR